jgi:hypothetical protein
MTLRPFQGWPARWVGNLRLSSTPLNTSRRTPMFQPEYNFEIFETWFDADGLTVTLPPEADKSSKGISCLLTGAYGMGYPGG